MSRGSGSRTILVASDPVTLPNAVWFREDFAAVELEELLSPLRRASPVPSPPSADPGLGIEIPFGSEALGVWTKPMGLTRTTAVRELNLWARVEGLEGRNRHLLVGALLETLRPLRQGELPPINPPPIGAFTGYPWVMLRSRWYRQSDWWHSS